MILSIQSHVSYGHVGNSCATFPLRVLGHEVIPINTVNFSNHTGYKSFKGHYTSKEQILNVFRGIMELENLKIDALLTGYTGDLGTIEAICEIYQELKTKNPNLLYFCDPVMGDHGKFYVKEGIPEFIKSKLLPLADYIFPNQFEFSYLVGSEEINIKNIYQKSNDLLECGLKGIIISSFQDKEGSNIKTLYIDRETDGVVETPTLELSKSMRMAGTGDLLASLFSGNVLNGKSPIQSLEKSVNSLFTILQNTLDKGRLELDLVGSQGCIVNGAIIFKASK